MPSRPFPSSASSHKKQPAAPPPYASAEGVAGRMHRWALPALAFCIPLLYPLQNICIILASAGWIFSGQAGGARRRLRESSAVLWWMLFLVWHILSLVWSADLGEGIGDVTRKASFLIMPLVVGAAWRADRALLERCYAAFVFGVLGAGIFGVVAAGVAPAGPAPHAFFYDWLVRFVDDIAVSAAWKCLLALLILSLHRFESTPFEKAAVRHLFFAALIVYFVLLSAKTLLVLGIGILMAALLVQMIMKRRERFWHLGLSLFIPLALTLAWNIEDSPLRKRFRDVSGAANAGLSPAEDIRHADNYNKRMAVWTAAWQNLTTGSTWLLGTGIGDVQDAQDKRVRSADFVYKRYANLYELHDYKVDSMYLQTWLGLGIPGLLILGSLLTSFFFGAVRKRVAVAAIFVAVSAVFFLQESMLQSQTGIVTATFFTCLWAAVYKLRMNPLGRNAARHHS